jgi:fructokinase
MTTNDSGILCLGELVWDCFATGDVLGGAPLNVAAHLAAQGARVRLLSAVGRDLLGEAALAFLAERRIPGVRIHPQRPTGTVRVRVDGDGVPGFTIEPGAAWTDLAGAREVEPDSLPLWLGRGPLVLVFCGLAMHSAGNRELLDTLLGQARSAGREPRLLCDLNLRPGWAEPEVLRWCLERADILKVNEEELARVQALAGLPAQEHGRAVAERYGLEAVCTTLGPAGLRWDGRDGATWVLPALTAAEGAPAMVDTVGAGDSVTAAIALGLLEGRPAPVFLDLGRRWAARICGVRGGIVPLQ